MAQGGGFKEPEKVNHAWRKEGNSKNKPLHLRNYE